MNFSECFLNDYLESNTCNMTNVNAKHNATMVVDTYSGHPWDTADIFIVEMYIVVTHNQLAVIQRWPLLIQWNLYIVVTPGTQPVGCYTEMASAYTVEPVYSGHP